MMRALKALVSRHQGLGSKSILLMISLALGFLTLSLLLWFVHASKIDRQAQASILNTQHIVESRITALSSQMLSLAHDIEHQLQSPGDWQDKLSRERIDAFLRGSEVDLVLAWDDNQVIHLAREYEYFTDQARSMGALNVPLVRTMVEQLSDTQGYNRGVVYVDGQAIYTVALGVENGGTIVVATHIESLMQRMARELGVALNVLRSPATVSAAGGASVLSSDISLAQRDAARFTLPALKGGDLDVEIADVTPADLGLSIASWLLLVGIGLASLIAVAWRWAYQPVVDRAQDLLTQLSEIQASHDYSQRVSVKGNDELARIGQRFNSVFTALEYAYQLMAKNSMVTSELIDSLKHQYREQANEQLTDSASREIKFNMEMASDLSRCLDEDRIELYFQPQYQTNPMRVVAVEALMRWFDDEHGAVSPRQILSVAEQSGLGHILGERILNKACHTASTWQKRGFKSTLVSINVTEDYFYSEELLPQITRALTTAGLEGKCLELEVSEAALAANSDLAHAIISKLNQNGVSVAIDDFSGHYVPIYTLPNWPVSKLKLSSAFLSATTPERAEFLQNIISIGTSLGRQVVVKGVEEQQQLAMIDTACENVVVQGLFTGEPMPGPEVEQYLEGQEIEGARLFNFPTRRA